MRECLCFYRCARLTAETTALSEAVTMFASMPTPHRIAVADGALDVGGGLGVAAGGQRVLGVVEHPDVDADGSQRVDERGDRAVAAARRRVAGTPSTTSSTDASRRPARRAPVCGGR